VSLGTWTHRRAKGRSGPDVPPVDSNGSNGRLSGLLLAAEAVRRPRTERDIRKILQFLGMLAIALGFLSIGLGWYGAAHSGYQYEEIPFLISGGIFGLGLILAGGVLVRSAWSLRAIEEARRIAAEAHRDAMTIAESVQTLQRGLEGSAENSRVPMTGRGNG
jgi:hypothetical protein